MMNAIPASVLLMAGPGGDKGGFMSLLPLILIFIVFYFFMIRPQMKKQKEMKKFRENIKKGDRIITIGGIHGRIIDVQEKTFIIETEGGNRLKIEKTAVSMDSSTLLQEKQ